MRAALGLVACAGFVAMGGCAGEKAGTNAAGLQAGPVATPAAAPVATSAAAAEPTGASNKTAASTPVGGVAPGTAPGTSAAATPGPRRENPSLSAELRARERREVDAFKARKNLEELQSPTPPAWFTADVTTDGNDLVIPGSGRAARLPAAYDAAFDAANAAAVQIPRAALPDATPARAAFVALPSGGFRVWMLTRTRNPNMNVSPAAAPSPPPPQAQPINPPPPIDLPK